MTELEFLHSRIFSDDDAVREAVSSDDIRRYMQLEAAKKTQEHERQEILAELRQNRDQEVDRQTKRGLRGVDLIARGLRRL